MDSRVAYLVAIVCGAVFAGGSTVLQCIALMVFPTACIVGRRDALKTIAVFFLVACLPVLWIVHSYAQSAVLAFVQYVALVSLNTFFIAGALFQTKVPRALSLPIALVIVSVPPLSAMNPVSLLPLAGWLFPGMKLTGIVLLLIIVALSTLVRRWWIPSLTLVIAVLAPISHTYALQSDEALNAVNIVRPHDERLDTDMMRIAYRYEELDLIALTGASVVVLPESVFGQWSPFVGSIINQSKSRVYGGARHYVDADHYINVMVDGKTGIVVYEQQSPPTLGRIGAARAVSGQGEKVATGLSFLICYELADTWVVLNTFYRTDRPVVWSANLSWFNAHYLEHRLRSNLHAWSRLFSVPVQTAVMSHD